MSTTIVKPTDYFKALQVNKGSRQALVDARLLAKKDKNNTTARRMIFGGREVPWRKMVEFGKGLQQIDQEKHQHTFTRRNARKVYNEVKKEVAAKEHLAQVKSKEADTTTLQKKEDDADRKKAAYVRTKELEAEGKQASLKSRPNAAVSVGQTQSANATVSAAEPPPAIDMQID